MKFIFYLYAHQSSRWYRKYSLHSYMEGNCYKDKISVHEPKTTVKIDHFTLFPLENLKHRIAMEPKHI